MGCCDGGVNLAYSDTTSCVTATANRQRPARWKLLAEYIDWRTPKRPLNTLFLFFAHRGYALHSFEEQHISHAYISLERICPESARLENQCSVRSAIIEPSTPSTLHSRDNLRNDSAVQVFWCLGPGAIEPHVLKCRPRNTIGLC